MPVRHRQADQIKQALLTDGSLREFELLHEYRPYAAPGMVLALDNDVVMMNDYARQVLDRVISRYCSSRRPRPWPAATLRGGRGAAVGHLGADDLLPVAGEGRFAWLR